jgi:hypothetical protein
MALPLARTRIRSTTGSWGLAQLRWRGGSGDGPLGTTRSRHRGVQAKLPVPLERSERCGPERCSGTFRTVAPAAARYVLHVRKINFQMKRRTRPDTVFEKRESDQTTKLLVRVVLFSARSLPRAPTLNPSPREKPTKKCTPTRQLLAELPSFSLHPRHDSTWAMSFGQDQ